MHLQVCFVKFQNVSYKTHDVFIKCLYKYFDMFVINCIIRFFLVKFVANRVAEVNNSRVKSHRGEFVSVEKCFWKSLASLAGSSSLPFLLARKRRIPWSGRLEDIPFSKQKSFGLLEHARIQPAKSARKRFMPLHAYVYFFTCWLALFYSISNEDLIPVLE